MFDEERKHLLDMQLQKLSTDEYTAYVTLYLLCKREYKEIFNNSIMLYRGQCVISMERLAERMSCDRRKAQYTLCKLKNKGFITWRKADNYGFNIYTVCVLAEPKNKYEIVFDWLCVQRKQRTLDEDEKYLYDHLKNIYGDD